MRYIAVLGPNTNQWWAYDNDKDVYIDPPIFVLDEINKYSNDVIEQENYFNELLEKESEWLNDKEYTYKDIEI